MAFGKMLLAGHRGQSRAGKIAPCCPLGCPITAQDFVRLARSLSQPYNKYTYLILHFYLAPSLIQNLTTFGFGFSFSKYEAEEAPLLYTREPDKSSLVEALLSKRPFNDANRGMRFAKLLFSSQESNFFINFTSVCLSPFERNVQSRGASQIPPQRFFPSASIRYWKNFFQETRQQNSHQIRDIILDHYK